MKVVIFGASGMLGRYVSSYLIQDNIEVIQVCRKDFEINLETKILEIICKIIIKIYQEINLKKILKSIMKKCHGFQFLMVIIEIEN
jgi:nucleoside-diphosphate-sugar epimerase